LYKIATNKAIDCQRMAKRFSVVSLDAPLESESDAYTMADAVEGDEPEPFEDTMNREIICKVREAVASLPEQMRQAVYMVYFKGMTYREAADAVGIHFTTLSVRLKHAISKLDFMLKNVG